MVIITSASISIIMEHQRVFWRARVSSFSVTDHVRHTDWLSAENQLTYDLLAVTLTPLPLSYRLLGIWHVCAQNPPPPQIALAHPHF